MNSSKIPKIRIGLAVYNGEKFIRSKLRNILSQTFSDFELVISDDSTDSTPKICLEFEKKDGRVHYIKQEKRRNWQWNYVFLLKNAITKYFVWTAVDDLWSNDFLGKNIAVLESNKNVIGSIGKVGQFDDNGIIRDEFEILQNDSVLRKIYKKFRRHFRPWISYSLYGSYEKKSRQYLKSRAPMYGYGVMRTEEFKKSVLPEPLTIEWERAYFFNFLKYGNFHVVDKTLMYYYMQGMSGKGIINNWKKGNHEFKEIIFPTGKLILWCLRKLGGKFFIKNLDLMIWLFWLGEVQIIVELFKALKSKS